MERRRRGRYVGGERDKYTTKLILSVHIPFPHGKVRV